MPHEHHLNIAEYPTISLLNIVADLLEAIIKENDKLLIHSNITHFHSKSVPNIGVHAYLTRILKFASFSNEVLLSILIYFDRIVQTKGPEYAVSSLTVHRLLITSIVVASKFTSDVFYSNKRYAKIGGLSLYELNKLELKFLFLCNFDLHVKLENMQAYGNQLLSHAFEQSIFPPSPPQENKKRKRTNEDCAVVANKKILDPSFENTILTYTLS